MRVLCTMLAGVPAAPGAPVIAPANIQPLFPAPVIPYEPDAIGHWNFGTANPNMLDAISGLKVELGWAINVTAGGSGYTSAPTVSISGGGGSGMTAEAVVTGGAVTLIRLKQPGSGYASLPTVTLSGGGGSGATASIARGAAPVLSNGFLTTVAGSRNGLILPISDRAVLTYCMVVKAPPAAGVGTYMGTIAASDVAAGDLVYFQDGKITVNTRPTASLLQPALPADMVADESWLFIALSQSATARTVMVGGAPATTLAVAKTPSQRNIGVGSAYAALGGAPAISMAECFAIGANKTTAELGDIYLRTKARMLEQHGFTVL